MPKMAALLLIGGKSSRMGADKSTIQWKGHSLLHHQMTLLRDCCDETYLSINQSQQHLEKSDHQCIVDQFEAIGPLGGIATSLSRINKDLLVLPIDMPLLTVDLIKSLTTKGKSSCFLLEGQVAPFPSYWSIQLLPEILTSIKNNRLSVTRFIIQNNFDRIKTDHVNAFLNMNTPSDLI